MFDELIKILEKDFTTETTPESSPKSAHMLALLMHRYRLHSLQTLRPAFAVFTEYPRVYEYYLKKLRTFYELFYEQVEALVANPALEQSTLLELVHGYFNTLFSTDFRESVFAIEFRKGPVTLGLDKIQIDHLLRVIHDKLLQKKKAILHQLQRKYDVVKIQVYAQGEIQTLDKLLEECAAITLHTPEPAKSPLFNTKSPVITMGLISLELKLPFEDDALSPSLFPLITTEELLTQHVEEIVQLFSERPNIQRLLAEKSPWRDYVKKHQELIQAQQKASSSRDVTTNNTTRAYIQGITPTIVAQLDEAMTSASFRAHLANTLALVGKPALNRLLKGDVNSLERAREIVYYFMSCFIHKHQETTRGAYNELIEFLYDDPTLLTPEHKGVLRYISAHYYSVNLQKTSPMEPEKKSALISQCFKAASQGNVAFLSLMLIRTSKNSEIETCKAQAAVEAQWAVEIKIKLEWLLLTGLQSCVNAFENQSDEAPLDNPVTEILNKIPKLQQQIIGQAGLLFAPRVQAYCPWLSPRAIEQQLDNIVKSYPSHWLLKIAQSSRTVDGLLAVLTREIAKYPAKAQLQERKRQEACKKQEALYANHIIGYYKDRMDTLTSYQRLYVTPYNRQLISQGQNSALDSEQIAHIQESTGLTFDVALLPSTHADSDSSSSTEQLEQLEQQIVSQVKIPLILQASQDTQEEPVGNSLEHALKLSAWFVEARAYLQLQATDEDFRDAQGNTLLHIAARHRQFSVIPLLLEAGLRWRMTNNAGQLVYQYAELGTDSHRLIHAANLVYHNQMACLQQETERFLSNYKELMDNRENGGMFIIVDFLKGMLQQFGSFTEEQHLHRTQQYDEFTQYLTDSIMLHGDTRLRHALERFVDNKDAIPRGMTRSSKMLKWAIAVLENTRKAEYESQYAFLNDNESTEGLFVEEAYDEYQARHYGKSRKKLPDSSGSSRRNQSTLSAVDAGAGSSAAAKGKEKVGGENAEASELALRNEIKQLQKEQEQTKREREEDKKIMANFQKQLDSLLQERADRQNAAATGTTGTPPEAIPEPERRPSFSYLHSKSY